MVAVVGWVVGWVVVGDLGVVQRRAVAGRRGWFCGRLAAAHDRAAPGEVWGSRCAGVDPLVVVAAVVVVVVVVVIVVAEVEVHLVLLALELLDVLVRGGAFDVGGRLGSPADVEARATGLGDQVRLGGVLPQREVGVGVQVGIGGAVVGAGVRDGGGGEGNGGEPQVGRGATMGVGQQRRVLGFWRRCAASQLCGGLGMGFVQGFGRGNAGREAAGATSHNTFWVFGAMGLWWLLRLWLWLWLLR